MELHKKIEALLEKYLDGMTSIAEEKELKNYFLSSNVAAHLQQYQPIFAYFGRAKNEKFVRILPLKNARIKIKWLSIAASISILFGIGSLFYFNTDSQKTADLGTFDNPETALIETQRQLFLISENINKGYKSVAIINEYQQSKNLIFK
jgi:hypothetical protein